MSNSNPAVICLSGGLDSTSLLLRLLAEGRTVHGLSFDYGQKHKLEIERLNLNLKYLASHRFEIQWHLIDLSSLTTILHSALTDPTWEIPVGHYESDNMKETVVPNRNAIFASIAFANALSISQRLNAEVDICLGVHSGDHTIYPDCRPEFYEAIHHAFQIGNWDADSIALYLPFLELDKSEIIQDSIRSIEKLGLDFHTVFRNTITSYAPDITGKSSGLTGSDVERILAFDKLGMTDPIEYFDSWDNVVANAKAMEEAAQTNQR